ncbi:hypothetical protein JXR93_02665 [bacterium]|nr:hypothetical protein [bacterium]
MKIDRLTEEELFYKLLETNDKNEVIRDWATFGIGSQIDLDNEKIRAALWKRVDDTDSDTKFEAISGLAKRGDLKIKETIRNELIAGEFGSLIFEAIDYLDGKEFLPLLKECFEKSQKESDINPSWLSDLKNIINSLEER